jgi:hypothetical protein
MVRSNLHVFKWSEGFDSSAAPIDGVRLSFDRIVIAVSNAWLPNFLQRFSEHLLALIAIAVVVFLFSLGL